MAWVWAKMKGLIFFANFTIEKLTKVLICTPLCIARPLIVHASLRSARTINGRAAPPTIIVRGLPPVATQR